MFALIKSFDGLDYYGNVPELPQPPDSRVEVFTFSDGDRDLLTWDLAPAANRLCDTTLDLGDVDFLDAKNSKLLLDWLNKRQVGVSKGTRLQELYQILSEYLKEAIRLNTGVVIEL